MNSINDIIVLIVVSFVIIGAVDKLIGNRFGLGERFTAGIMAMGPLVLAMVGIISLAPVLAKLAIPVIAPVYGLINADPASFANTILALDMGGYSLAVEMSESKEAETFAWVFLGTMMGPTLVFTIPVALGIIEKEDQHYLAKGIMVGIITTPIGCLVGGLVAGIELTIILTNLIVPSIFSILLAIGLWKWPTQLIQIFTIFGKGIEGLSIIGLVAIIVETLTGFVIIPGLAPLSEGILLVGTIVIFLAGAFPMVTFIAKVGKRPLKKIGTVLRINEQSTAGLVASLAHSIPMFTILKEMDPRGKVINVAFAVSGAFVFGGHLGFVAGINKEVVFAMVVGKLVGGISAIVLALITSQDRA